MPLPKVLIIGAMKAGTTSLYMDVAGHPDAFMAQEKEPHALTDDGVLTSEGRSAYEALYALARPNALCCDASTGYSKRPDCEGVLERAIRTLPAGFKVIYLVRHPIERIVSQHHHEHFAGLVGPSIDEEVRRHPRYIQYSRYAYQLAPWLEKLGNERVCVVRFEDYASHRLETVGTVYDFLGLSRQFDAVSGAPIYNKSQGKPLKGWFWQRVRRGSVYRRWIRPYTAPELRLALQQRLLPPAVATLAAPSAQTVDFLRDALRDDVMELGSMLKRPMLWDGFEAPAAQGSQLR